MAKIVDRVEALALAADVPPQPLDGGAVLHDHVAQPRGDQRPEIGQEAAPFLVEIEGGLGVPRSGWTGSRSGSGVAAPGPRGADRSATAASGRGAGPATAPSVFRDRRGRSSAPTASPRSRRVGRRPAAGAAAPPRSPRRGTGRGVAASRAGRRPSRRSVVRSRALPWSRSIRRRWAGSRSRPLIREMTRPIVADEDQFRVRMHLAPCREPSLGQRLPLARGHEVVAAPAGGQFESGLAGHEAQAPDQRRAQARVAVDLDEPGGSRGAPAQGPWPPRRRRGRRSRDRPPRAPALRARRPGVRLAGPLRTLPPREPWPPMELVYTLVLWRPRGEPMEKRGERLCRSRRPGP